MIDNYESYIITISKNMELLNSIDALINISPDIELLKFRSKISDDVLKLLKDAPFYSHLYQ